MSKKTFYDLVPGAPKGRFDNVKRNYSVEDVEKLRGSFPIDTVAAEGLGFRPSDTVQALDRYARSPD